MDQLITERAVAYQAQRMGMEVTEADVAAAIRSILPQLFQGDQFAGRDAYASFLSQQNLTIESFEASVTRQVLLERMRSIALQGVIVSPQEIEQAFRARNDKTKIEYVKVSAEVLKSQVKPSRAEQMRDYFTKAAASFRIPEKRSLNLLVVDQAKVEASVNVPEADLERVYKAEPDRFRIPDRVKARHILIGTSDKPKEDEPKLKAKAEALLKQLRGGADFAKPGPGELRRQRLQGQGRHARLGPAWTDGSGIREGRVRAEAERDQRSGEDHLRLSHHSGARKRIGAYAQLRRGEERDRSGVEAAAGGGAHAGPGRSGRGRIAEEFSAPGASGLEVRPGADQGREDRAPATPSRKSAPIRNSPKWPFRPRRATCCSRSRWALPVLCSRW